MASAEDQIVDKATYNLAPETEKLLNSLNLDPALASQLEVDSEILPMYAAEEYGELTSKDTIGILIKPIHNKYLNHLYRTLKHHNDSDLQIFEYEGNDYDKYIGIIKSEEQFAIIDCRKTSAPNYDFTTKDILDSLKKWNNDHPFRISGVGRDWVRLDFENSIIEEKAFHKEIEAFCPDVIEWYSATRQEVNLQSGGKSLTLWWD